MSPRLIYRVAVFLFLPIMLAQFSLIFWIFHKMPETDMTEHVLNAEYPIALVSGVRTVKFTDGLWCQQIDPAAINPSRLQFQQFSKIYNTAVGDLDGDEDLDAVVALYTFTGGASQPATLLYYVENRDGVLVASVVENWYAKRGVYAMRYQNEFVEVDYKLDVNADPRRRGQFGVNNEGEFELLSYTPLTRLPGEYSNTTNPARLWVNRKLAPIRRALTESASHC
ncbi:MAG: hypothetical protein AAF787_00715 [Chloroflexota bacterium]